MGVNMKRTLLVVDDEKDMLHLLKRSLEPDLDCKVKTASSVDEALEHCREINFDLILADIQMPGIDGLNIFRNHQKENTEPDSFNDDGIRHH